MTVHARVRRGPADIGRIRDAIVATLSADWPMTVRQLFYQLVSTAVIAKSEAEYKGTVVRLLGLMRRSGEVSFDWIADNTRWMRKPATEDSLAQFLEDSARTYRRSLWNDQGAYVEIWLEKDALSGVLYPITSRWDVPLMVTRGYPSITYLHDAAETIQARGKPAHLYYFGDHDPSGVDITRAVEEGIREFAPGADITFERVAVTRDQIVDLGLPTRPTKTTDSRHRGFEGESVEVDAIPPAELRRLVEDCIACHVDQDALERTRLIEEEERKVMRKISLKHRG